jgi:hypothetical protein
VRGQCQLLDKNHQYFQLFHCQQTQSLLITLYNLFQNQKSTNTAFYLENTTDNLANFCFECVCKCRKKWGYERKLLTVVLVLVHRVFYSHCIISLKRYDMVATIFLYIIIILCYVINSTVRCQILAGRSANPKK